jgi:hypothetical protein
MLLLRDEIQTQGWKSELLHDMHDENFEDKACLKMKTVFTYYNNIIIKVEIYNYKKR